MRLRHVVLALAIVILFQGSLFAQQEGQALSPELSKLYQRFLENEKTVVSAVSQRAPVVETYVQGTTSDPVLRQVPNGDAYLLNRVQIGKNDDSVFVMKGSRKLRDLSSEQMLRAIDKLLGVSNGYVSMILPTTVTSFDPAQNRVTYLGRQTFGDVRTVIYYIAPNGGTSGFTGRLWVDEQTGFLVRMNGGYGGNYQFDSWRMNVQPDLWLPAFVYLEDVVNLNDPVADHFRAQLRIWGYSLKLPESHDDNGSVTVDNARMASDVSPLEAKRDFEMQGGQNIQQRLFESGLLAPPSEMDRVLEQVTNNLIVGAKLRIPPVHCRVLLTTPLESTAVGNTILISKGLIDTLPDEEHLAMMLAFQLAHITLGNKVQSRYSFSNTFFFDNTATYTNVALAHSVAENQAAATKAMEIMNASIYKDKMPSVALYLNQLSARAQLAALMRPRIGDGLFTSEANDRLWLQNLLSLSPKLRVGDLGQIAALPLNSQVKINPWDDSAQQLMVRRVPLQTAADKLPFEITPVSLRLTRAKAGVGGVGSY